MDTDCPIVPVRKYVTPIEDLECEEGDLGSSKPEKEVTLSTFERLPRELRQMVYLILGYPVGRQVLIKSSIIPTNIGCSFVSLRYKMQLRDTVTQAKVQKISISHWDAKPLGPRGSKHTNMSCLYPAPPHRYSACKSEDFFYCGRDVLTLHNVNKNIRAELIDTVFANTLIKFSLQLSEKAIYFSRRLKREQYPDDCLNTRCNMRVPQQLFGSLTRVKLCGDAGNDFPTNYPQREWEISDERRLARQASSITYLSDYCPWLKDFTLSPALGRYSDGVSRFKGHLRSTAPQAVQPIIRALARLAEKCEYLEVIRVTPPTRDHASESEKAKWLACFDERAGADQEIMLVGVEWYTRDDKVLEEAEVVFRVLTCAVRYEAEVGEIGETEHGA